MSTFKDVLCLLAIFVAYGIAGRMDYDDAVMLEESRRASQRPAGVGCPPAASSIPENLAQPEAPDPSHAADVSAVEPCPAFIY